MALADIEILSAVLDIGQESFNCAVSRINGNSFICSVSNLPQFLELMKGSERRFCSGNLVLVYEFDGDLLKENHLLSWIK